MVPNAMVPNAMVPKESYVPDLSLPILFLNMLRSIQPFEYDPQVATAPSYREARTNKQTSSFSNLLSERVVM
jgi:hypothetical protein